MKILQITTELRIAGAEKVVAALSRGLRRRGHEVRVVSLAPIPNIEHTTVVPLLKEAEIGIETLEASPLKTWRLARLRQVVAEFRPALVHAHLFHANLAARIFGRAPHVPLINTVHIAERRVFARWQLWLDRLTLSRCTRQTAVSKAVRDFHAQHLGVHPETMPVVYNGIDVPPKLDAARIAALREEWGVAGARKVIGGVGRLDPQKGFDRLLRMLPELARQIPGEAPLAVVLLGEGPQRPALEQLAAKCADDIITVMPGFRADAAACIGAFDLFSMPSRYEGFGLTLAEAMAHGVPIAAADVDSLPELLAGYPSGICMPFADLSVERAARELAGALRLAPCSPEFRFSVDAMVDGYESLYRELTAKAESCMPGGSGKKYNGY